MVFVGSVVVVVSICSLCGVWLSAFHVGFGMVVFFVCYLLCLFFFFFFSSRRRHTRSTRDWSSDVCSSDLPHRAREGAVGARRAHAARHARRPPAGCLVLGSRARVPGHGDRGGGASLRPKIGRASCRERV